MNNNNELVNFYVVTLPPEPKPDFDAMKRVLDNDLISALGLRYNIVNQIIKGRN